MSDAVIVALITVGANLVVTLVSAAVQSKSVMEKSGQRVSFPTRSWRQGLKRSWRFRARKSTS